MTTKKQINLLRGWPNPALLPTQAILRAAQSALSDPSISTPGLEYGPDPGYQPLREEIAKWVGDFYGGEPDPDRICITGGASQNLACVLQVYTDPLKTNVWMVAPCYFLACRMFEDAGLTLRAIEEGNGGIDLVALEKQLEKTSREGGESKPLKRPTPWSKIYSNIIYCVPTFSNPSGKTMSLSTRESLVRLARKYDALIITDDVYDFLQFPTSPTMSASSLSKALLPRLVDLDRTLQPMPSGDNFGNAVSNGSFSKIAGPGVRTGWAEATPKFTYGLSQCGSSRSGGAPSQLAATMMAVLLKNGELQSHIKDVLNPTYKRRYESMLEAIQTHLVPLNVKVGEVNFEGKAVFGGYFIWLELPKDTSARLIAERAKEKENLIVAPGHVFEVSGDSSIQFKNSLRLCFSWEEEADLKEAVFRLARVVKDNGDDSGLSSRNIGVGVDNQDMKQDLGEFQ
ncbi:related to aminotransferase [Rhynchosporium agropyri]|uniref:Related to aminotransferase n=1 Tax=Rhynchosporium agropyri TaxID=914238 RepID=A0A1E1L9T0_9HELO|nr:related to aminotransferase [Rhynchosporium agropyri]